MTNQEDIRWQQRFNSFQKALNRLKEVVDKTDRDSLSELEKEGVIQRFEYTFELSWKTLQDLLFHKGYSDVKGPNPVLAQSFKDGYITDHDGWRTMKKGRETTSHTYNEGDAANVVSNIYDKYVPLLKELEKRLIQETDGIQGSLF